MIVKNIINFFEYSFNRRYFVLGFIFSLLLHFFWILLDSNNINERAPSVYRVAYKTSFPVFSFLLIGIANRIIVKKNIKEILYLIVGAICIVGVFELLNNMVLFSAEASYFIQITIIAFSLFSDSLGDIALVALVTVIIFKIQHNVWSWEFVKKLIRPSYFFPIMVGFFIVKYFDMHSLVRIVDYSNLSELFSFLLSAFMRMLRNFALLIFIVALVVPQVFTFQKK